MWSEVSVRLLSLYISLIPAEPMVLMMVTNRQHQRNKATQHQSSDLHLAQSLPSIPSRSRVAVTDTPYLRKDMDRSHVEEGAGREEHG